MITPPRFIRENVLDMSQTDLAKELGVSQPAVAKYERAGAFPDHHRKKIRELAKKKKKDLPESWFDQLPMDNQNGTSQKK